jgi:hypothetical protein
LTSVAVGEPKVAAEEATLAAESAERMAVRCMSKMKIRGSEDQGVKRHDGSG